MNAAVQQVGVVVQQYAVRSIHQIEVTSRCNLKCTYCPSYRLPRPKQDMNRETFIKALRWAKKLEDLHGHGELNLAGIGESTLHPNFLEYLALAREAMGPHVHLVLATNGLLVTDELARAMAPYHPRVYVSLHRPEKAKGAVMALRKYGLLAGVSCDAALDSTNWAGQVDWPVTTPAAGNDCDWFKTGKVIVLSDGRVSRCSFDATGKGVIGTVDDDLLKLTTSRWELCATCHLKT